MNLKGMIHSILYSASSRARNEGNLLFKKGLATNIKGKSIDGIYHIYGKVSEEANDYNSHLKVDIDKAKIVGSSCTCEESLENSKYMKGYLCKHNLATTYMFYNLAKKRISKENKTSTVKIVKEEYKRDVLNLDIKIKHIKALKIEYYEVEFRIGRGSTYLINDLEDFTNKRERDIPYNVTQQFTYYPRRSFFSKEDETILKFIQSYIEENKIKRIGQYKKVHGKTLRIVPEEIGNLLCIIKGDKKIILNYDYIDYNTEVYKRDLPLGFTLKLIREKFVLRTKVNFPIPLNEKHQAYLYDRKIYMPSDEQIKYYKPLYSQLKSNGEIKLEKSIKEISGLVNMLSKISNDVLLDEGAQRLVSQILKPQFYFDREWDKLSCKVKINYGGKLVDILNDSNNSFLRDLKKEEKIDRELERLSFIKRDGIFIFVGEDEEVFNLLSYGLFNLSTMGSINLSKEFKSVKVLKASSMNVEIEQVGDEFYLNYNQGAFDIRELQSSLQALNENKRFFKTKDNNFLDLTDPDVVSFLNIVDVLEIGQDDKIRIDKNRVIYLNQNKQSENLKFIRGKEKLNHIKDKLLNRECKDLKQPIDLNATLREYQVLGLNWINTLSELGFGGILADEMGLGKTIQTIAFLLSKKGSKSIVITPTSLIYNWEDEFIRFAPNLNIGIVHGNATNRNKVLDNIDEYDVVVTTYGTLKNDIENYEKKIFDYCIIDEGQNIKNPTAQVTNTVKKINGICKIALTGTPIENNLMELWSIFDFIMPEFLFSKAKFKEKFLLNGDKGLDELKELINPFILRRIKKDVLLELPDKIEKKVLVEMTTAQKHLYKSYMKDIKTKLKMNNENRITVFSYLTKLRQLCLDPSLVIDEYMGGSGKLEVAMKITTESVELGNKVLLFSQFTTVLHKIKEQLDLDGIDYLYLDGSTSAKQRINLVNEFNESEEKKVFLISLKAGGTGLNLTSANVVIHFDPWWNPAIEDQATDRAHRIGQKNVVEVIKLISQDTIEEKIVRLQEDKKELINRVMNGEDMDSKNILSLTDKEILDLFN